MLAPEGVDPLLNGGCFCGQVTYSIYGSPLQRAYCHCTRCQRLMGCPFVHAIHVKEKDFVWTWFRNGRPAQEILHDYESSTMQYRRQFRCRECGTPLASFDARSGQYIVWGASLERGLDGEIKGWDQVKPTAHQFYGTRILDIKDELGKWEGYQEKSQRIGDGPLGFSR